MKAAARLTVFSAVLLLSAARVPAQQLQTLDKTVYLNEQESFTPGYLIGDIAIGSPAIADFKVLAGRREILLFGKKAGKTTLTIWDQQRIKRHEVNIAVADRKRDDTEKELRDLLKSYPGLQVATLNGALVITGTVTTQADRDAVEKLAGAAAAKNLVRYNPPVDVAAPGAGPVSSNPMPQPTGSSTAAPAAPAPQAPSGSPAPAPASAPATAASAPAPARPAAPAPPALGAVEYELEVLEASVQFRSGSYLTGVEPSGRSLFKKTITVTVNDEAEVFVPITAIEETKTTVKNAPKTAPEPIGLHLHIKPGPPAQTGIFPNYLLIETNVPVGQFTDTNTMRRARWQFPARTGEPVGIGGNELLAVADTANGASGLQRTRAAASMFSSLPGVSSIKGASYGSQVPYYNSKTKTQLLLIVHPKYVPPVK